MRRLKTACAAALLVVLPMGCSGIGQDDSAAGDSVDRGAGRSGSALARVQARIPEVKQLFARVPGPGEMATGSPDDFCAANLSAVKAGDFDDFKQAVRRIRTSLPDDMAEEPRGGYGVLLHVLEGADGRAQFTAGVNALDTDDHDLIHAFRVFSDNQCGALAPESAALA